MLQPVYDNDFIAGELIKAGIGPRWQPWVAAGQGSPWKTSNDFKSFEIDGAAAAPAWIRYQHFKPSFDTWDKVLGNQRVGPIQPSLITDDYAYNDEGSTCQRRKGTQVPVGDLAVEVQLNVKNDQGAMILELVKGGLQFRCRIELENGEAQLSISGLADFAPKASTKVSGPGEYHVMFSNVDQELLLWVNGELAKFDAPTTYPDLNNSEPVRTPPTPGVDKATDLSPVGIAVEGGAKVAVSSCENSARHFLSRCKADDWWIPKFVKEDGISNVVELQANQFFMMGDNSPESADSRVWGEGGSTTFDRQGVVYLLAAFVVAVVGIVDSDQGFRDQISVLAEFQADEVGALRGGSLRGVSGSQLAVRKIASVMEDSVYAAFASHRAW